MKTTQYAARQAMRMARDNPELAAEFLRRAVEADPEDLAARQVLGVILHQLGRDDEALPHFECLVELDPANPENYANLGSAYAGLGRHESAVRTVEKALCMDPGNAAFLNNLALSYRATGRHDLAADHLRLALSRAPSPVLWDNLGGVCVELGDYAEARRCYETAVRLDPAYTPAQVNLGLACHFAGDWRKGFEQYEWRFFYYPSLRGYLETYDVRKMWDGRKDLSGKHVLAFAEQGYGDMVMFARFLKGVADRGASVTLHCPPEMAGLLRRAEGVADVFTADVRQRPRLPVHDYHVALMSLPHLLKIDAIDGKPYLDAPEPHPEVPPSEALRVGLVWAGGPDNPDDAERSIPVRFFRTLEAVAGVKLFSLQMGARARDAHEFTDLSGLLTDFEQTAGVVAALDLVICCDTAVAHVAGATGKPVWDLIRYGPDWRWPARTENTCWYDSMRQFHQTAGGDWDGVFARVREELAKISAAV